MIKLIVGLGNPGRQYEKTRHNVGFLFLNELADEFGVGWTKESRFQAICSEINIAKHKVLLLKPDTFMNHSGQSVGKVLRYYKLLPDEVLVVHDELDFDIGVVKLKKDGGHAGHNGLRDIILHLNSKDFYRLRVGIGRPAVGKSVADFVLSMPLDKDYQLLLTAFKTSRPIIDKMVCGELTVAMNVLNSLR